VEDYFHLKFEASRRVASHSRQLCANVSTYSFHGLGYGRWRWYVLPKSRHLSASRQFRKNFISHRLLAFFQGLNKIK